MIGNKYHWEGYNKAGKKIIIDLADIGIGFTGEHTFEVMTLYPNGREIDTFRTPYLHTAKAEYERMVRDHAYNPEKPEQKPLTGKYAKLRDDLAKALEAGRRAEATNPEDGGTCNFDSAGIDLPRWQEAKIKQAAKEAGTHAWRWHRTLWVFAPDTHGQGNARSRNAEAMTQALKSMGYEALDYCQMD